MPTESEFLDAAILIRRALTDVEAAHRHVTIAHELRPISGGTVASVAALAGETALSDVAAIRSRLVWIAEQCDRRALVCAEHRAELRRWSAEFGHWESSIDQYWAARSDPSRLARWPGPEPVRPQAPFEWVEPR